jgi:tape measure domain-containing protein
VAQSTVKLIVDAQNAIRPLQRVNKETTALSKSTDKLKGRLDKSNRSIRDTGKSATGASAGVKKLTGSLAPLLKALAVAATARFIFVKTAELETQRKSLEVLTGSLEKTKKIIDELQQFSAITPFTSSELIDQTKRLKAFGFETEELVDTTRRLAEVAGATGADLQGIATAFGQIRAKGKLQQEENLQLLERGVDITTELKRITGLQGDAFEKAQRQGKIGADLVNQALINLTNEGGKFFGGATKQADTLNGQLSTLIDNVEKLAIAIGDFLEPALKRVFKEANRVLGAINRLISSEFQRDISKLRFQLEIAGGTKKDLENIKDFVNSIPTEGISIANADLFKSQLEGTSKQLKDVAREIQRQRPFGLTKKEIKAFEQAQGAILKKIKEIEKARERIKKGEKDILDINKDKNKPTKDTNKPEPDTLSDEQKANIKDFASGIVGVIKLENDRKEAFKKYIDKQKQSGELIQASIDGNTKEVQLQHDINNAVAIHGEHNRQKITDQLTANQALRDQKTEIDKNAEAAEALKGKFAQIGQEIEDGIVQNLTNAVKGTQTLAEAAIKVLNQMKRKLVEIAIQKAFAGIGGPIGGFFGSLFGRANGGRVSANQPYMVGERGREVFVPTTSGTIIPNNQMGGTTNNIVVNVDASGSAVEGDEDRGRELGRLISVAVQSELVQQKRPGGLLA